MSVLRNHVIPHDVLMHYTPDFITKIQCPYLESVDSALASDCIREPSIWQRGTHEQDVLIYSGHIFKGIPGLVKSALPFKDSEIYWFSDIHFAYLYCVEKWCGLHCFYVENLRLCDFNNPFILSEFLDHIRNTAPTNTYTSLEHFVRLFYGWEYTEEQMVAGIIKQTGWDTVWIYDEPIHVPRTGKYDLIEEAPDVNPCSHLKGRYLVEKTQLAQYYISFLNSRGYDGLIQRQLKSKYDANGLSLEEIILTNTSKLKEDYSHPAHWKNWLFSPNLYHLRGVDIPMRLYGCGKGRNHGFCMLLWHINMRYTPVIPYNADVLVWNAISMNGIDVRDTKHGLLNRVLNFAAKSNVSIVVINGQCDVCYVHKWYTSMIRKNNITIFSKSPVFINQKNEGIWFRHNGYTYSIGCNHETDVIYAAHAPEIYTRHTVTYSAPSTSLAEKNVISYKTPVAVFAIRGSFGQTLPLCIIPNPWGVWYRNIQALQILKRGVLKCKNKSFADKAFTRLLFLLIRDDFTVNVKQFLCKLYDEVPTINQKLLTSDYTSNLLRVIKIPEIKYSPDDECIYVGDQKCNPPQLAKLAAAYTGTSFAKDVFILYEFYSMTNTNFQCAYTNEKFDVELFSSPFNSATEKYCSLFSLETNFGGMGKFENYTFIPNTTYLANPPFDEKIILCMSKILVTALKCVPNITIVVTIPIWDPQTRKELHLPYFSNDPFEGYSILKDCKFLVEHKTYSAESFPYHDYYKNKSSTVSATHYMRLKN